MFKQQSKVVSSATKLIILERFIKDFESCMENQFYQKRDYELTFDDFCNLMYGIGFIKLPYNNKYNDEFDHKDFAKKKVVKKVKYIRNYGSYGVDYGTDTESLELRTKMYRRGKEYSFLKEAWRVLTEGINSVGLPENEIQIMQADKVNSNQVVIFCVSILGLYEGDGLGNSPTKSVLLSPLTMSRDPSEPFFLLGKNENTESKENLKINQINQLNRISKSPVNEKRQNRNVKIAQIRMDSSGSAKTGPLSARNRKKTDGKSVKSYTTRARNCKVLLKAVIPEFDFIRYNYPPSTVKQVHNKFRQFYVNRVDYLVDLKKKLENEHIRSKSVKDSETNSFSFSLNHTSYLSAQNWREKKINV